MAKYVVCGTGGYGIGSHLRAVLASDRHKLHCDRDTLRFVQANSAKEAVRLYDRGGGVPEWMARKGQHYDAYRGRRRGTRRGKGNFCTVTRVRGRLKRRC